MMVTTQSCCNATTLVSWNLNNFHSVYDASNPLNFLVAHNPSCPQSWIPSCNFCPMKTQVGL